MRGGDQRSGALFSYVDLEGRAGKDHPLRTIHGVVNEALAALSREFSALYSRSGRPSIAPEKLLRAMLLRAFYSSVGRKPGHITSDGSSPPACSAPGSGQRDDETAPALRRRDLPPDGPEERSHLPSDRGYNDGQLLARGAETSVTGA